VLRDLRFAIRMLLKQPGFSLIAVLTLALGIGATSAVFSLIQGVLLTPPPYRQPDQLVLIPSVRTDGQKQETPRAWPAEQWMDWQQKTKSFQGIAAYSWTFEYMIHNDGSESIEGMVVTPDYFQVTGLQPMLGRTFTEQKPGTAPAAVVLLGSEFWQRRFGGDPGIVRSNCAYQPLEDFAHGDRHHAAWRSVLAVAADRERTQLQRECVRRFLDSGDYRSSHGEVAAVERGRATARGRIDAVGAS